MAKGNQNDDNDSGGQGQGGRGNKQQKKGEKQQNWMQQVAHHPLVGGLVQEVSVSVRGSQWWKDFMNNQGAVASLFKALARNRVTRVLLNTALEELQRWGVPEIVINELQNLVEYSAEAPEDTHDPKKAKDGKSPLTLAYEELNDKLLDADRQVRLELYALINDTPKSYRGEVIMRLALMGEQQFADLVSDPTAWASLKASCAKEAGKDLEGHTSNAESKLNRLLTQLTAAQRYTLTDRLNAIVIDLRPRVTRRLSVMQVCQLQELAADELGWRALVESEKTFGNKLHELASQVGNMILGLFKKPTAEEEAAKQARMQRVRDQTKAARQTREEAKQARLAALERFKGA